ncbi:YdcF family protein [Saccharomonospora sp. CUA-673]|uniref:YdcF family protein n=1 Tax=Saccharomonospora sp. CUA-673 TaxID=1904969 RepID=UPI0035199AA3
MAGRRARRRRDPVALPPHRRRATSRRRRDRARQSRRRRGDLYGRAVPPRPVPPRRVHRRQRPTTVDRFPRGEAVHFREIALEHGVPNEATRIETRATNTVQNIDHTRRLLAEEGITPRTALIICRPYQQRRAQAIAAHEWPDVDILCTGSPDDLDTYLAHIGEPDRVASMLVGDTQRLDLQGRSGEIAPQQIPADVHAACQRLIKAGYTSRLITPRPDSQR